mmetsp:Transcript_15852/g.23714  ORF Transcript_15852/g.23714 Transcript_15852/m.23714 type:complete len:120 (+) Transcript_15852:23-382(+)
MKNKQQEGKEWPERSTEPSLPIHQHHRNVHSVPPSIHRSRSLPPRFVCNKWGSEETRKSYKCLCSLANNTECKRCISSSTLNALDRYSIGKMRNPKWRDWWGNFLELSSDGDASATDDD